MLVKNITPKAGPSFSLNRITVLVGPNNSGKTETLRDLFRLVTNTEPAASGPKNDTEVAPVLLDEFHYDMGLSLDHVLRGVQTTTVEGPDDLLVQGIGATLLTAYSFLGSSEKVKNVVRRRPLTARAVWRSGIGNLMYLRAAYLDPETRLKLVRSSTAVSPTESPETLLQVLQYATPEKLTEWNAAVQAAFPEANVLLDDTERVRLTARVAASLPDRPVNPAEAARLYRKLRKLEDEGAGCRAYAGLVLALLVTEGRLVLLDQPETYLNADQTRLLGAWIGRNAKTLDSQIVIATHDVSFIAGLLSTSNEVDLVRLTRRKDATRYQLVPGEPARKLAHSPLLFGQRGLECLFRDGAIVTETEDDRALYQIVAVREFGAENIAFLHGYGRQTLAYITKLLHAVNVPTAVVAGLDLLQSKMDFQSVVEVATGQPVPTTWNGTRDKLAVFAESRFDRGALAASRREVEAFLGKFSRSEDEPEDESEGEEVEAAPSDETPVPGGANRWQQIHHNGVAAIGPDLRPWVEQLLEELKSAGIFVTPKGDSRRWVDSSPQPPVSNNWFIKALTDLHSRRCPAELRAFVADLLNFLKTRQTLEVRKGS